MGSFSLGHWLVVLAIIVLLFGAKKIPELAKGVGKGIKTFKKEMEDEEPVKMVKTDEKKDEVVQEIKQETKSV